MCKESLESRLVLLEGFAVGVSSRIEALENRVAELSTSTNNAMLEIASVIQSVIVESTPQISMSVAGDLIHRLEKIKKQLSA